ncbi:MAG: 4'-phosphopantetheinyl transferase superfamily protein [Candidatus Latescibacteria bacterium]|nr:4'-phosphopantetheinyl transferase superfamily protein [Candidatus Latescibacterota bacterium]
MTIEPRVGASRLSPPADLSLSPGEVHVWRASLDVSASRIQSLLRTVSADERARAERSRVQEDRDRFIVGRGVLRGLLARYLDIQPDQVCLSSTLYGKPILTGTHGGARLRFSVSHSHRLALYAVSRDREVGIDLEYRRPGRDETLMAIAEQFFSSREVKALRRLPVSGRAEGFYACWTRKEAYLKAKGRGLSLPLDQFVVSVTPGCAALLHTAWSPDEAARWSLSDLDPGPGYAAALAVEGECQCVQWQWPD